MEISSLMCDFQLSAITRQRNCPLPGRRGRRIRVPCRPGADRQASKPGTPFTVGYAACRTLASPSAMLFNSPEFILGFLPVALGGFFLLGRAAGPRWALGWLVAASLFFYGWWNPIFVLLLAGSIIANYAFAQHILHLVLSGRQPVARRWLSPASASTWRCSGGSNTPTSYSAAPRRRRFAHAGTQYLPAAGNQLLYLPADHVPGGELSRRTP